MTDFTKEDYDVSHIFLAYLAFLGNPTKVSIALDIPREVVEVLEEKENWEAKLNRYIGLRHEEALSETDRTIRRTVTYVQACHLREVIQRLIDHVHRIVKPEDLMDALSPRCPRTNRPKFSPRTFPDLCRAFQLVTRIINREIGIAEREEPDDEAKAKERLHIRELWTRVTSTADSIPGVDSVALARESLTKWDTRNDERPA